MKKIFAMGLALAFAGGLAFGQADEILKLKEKIIELQNKGELGFRNFNLCSNILGFGSYVPLPEPVIKKDEKLQLYYEPMNVFTSKREGLYEIWYTQDMVLLKPNGEVPPGMERYPQLQLYVESPGPGPLRDELAGLGRPWLRENTNSKRF